MLCIKRHKRVYNVISHLYKVQKWVKVICVVIRILVILWVLTGMQLKGASLEAENVLFLVLDGGYMDIYIKFELKAEKKLLFLKLCLYFVLCKIV